MRPTLAFAALLALAPLASAQAQEAAAAESAPAAATALPTITVSDVTPRRLTDRIAAANDAATRAACC